jgi:hypothetical protein
VFARSFPGDKLWLEQKSLFVSSKSGFSEKIFFPLVNYHHCHAQPVHCHSLHHATTVTRLSNTPKAVFGCAFDALVCACCDFLVCLTVSCCVLQPRKGTNL